jgi:CubicO group peptidase (beta-lactamase class C family)
MQSTRPAFSVGPLSLRPAALFLLRLAVLSILLAPSRAPAAALPRSAPHLQGVHARHLATFLKQWQAEALPIHSLLVLRHGTIVHETYAYPFRPGARHDIASCTKTITALLVGIAIDQGKLSGLDATLDKLFPGRSIDKFDERKRAITLEDLLAMQSGLASFNDGITLLGMQRSPDWVQFGLDLAVGRPPGQSFHYVSVNSHLLSGAVQQAVEMPTADFAREQLFEPLEIRDVGWPTDPAGIAHGWGDLRLQPTDMAKLGLLLLHEGETHGEQLVSRDWVRRMTTGEVATSNRFFPRYGFQCWVGDGVFAALGRGGQRIIVAPDRDLVIVVTAGADPKQEATLDRLCLELVASIDPSEAVAQAAIPQDPEADEQIAAYQQTLLAPPPKTEFITSPESSRVSGVRYQLATNVIAHRVKLEFATPDEARLELEFNPQRRFDTLLLPVGLDGVPRFGPGRYQEPAAALGTWTGPNTFRIDLDELANINHWTIELTFTGDELELSMHDRTGLPPVKVKGRAER